MGTSISEMVRKYREENKVSLRKFADKAGLKTATVAKIEKGFTHVQGETAKKIYKAMGMEPPSSLNPGLKPSKAPKTKFEVVEMEPWMEFKMQKTYSPVVIDLVEFLRTLPDRQPIKTSLTELGYGNIQSARNCLRSIAKRYNIPAIKVAEKNGILYVFKMANAGK
jgi:transcriptional regulator with XRE-family HTH domain